MKIAIKYLTGIVLLFAISLYLLYPDSQRTNPETADNSSPGQRGPAGIAVPDSPDSQADFYVSEAAVPGLSPAVRDLPAVAPDVYLEREIFPRSNPLLLSESMGQFDTSNRTPDPLAAVGLTAGGVPAPTLSFDGATRSTAGGFSPPDTVGDVGPNHYVQMVNVVFTIFDKNGTVLAGPTPFNQLFAGQGNICETQNDGDPIVVYDRLANRWLLSQFTWPSGMCIAISTTPNPTGSYHLYRFNTPQFPDYFKFGVWPDAYYMSANEGSYTAYAFDRTKMLNGQPATSQRITGGTNLYLPADLDGSTPPPAGAPNYFYTFKSSSFHGGSDRLEIWEFAVDFNTPANTSFTLAQTIPVTPFNYTVCGFFNFNCIRQLGTSQRVDAVSEWPMWRLPYRNFGTHEAMVGNFAVNVSGSDVAGIRWFELRRTGGGNWMLHQEGTYAPDGHSRWMGSIAMDKAGNIALGYSVSSSTMYPSIRYTVRHADDPLGTLRPEVSLIEGTTFFSANNRWGDYSSMNVDPSDDCTFWYTNQYQSSGSTTNWHTRVGAFVIPDCLEDELPGEADLALGMTASSLSLVIGDIITYTLQVDNQGPEISTGIVMTTLLPVELGFVSAGSNDGTCQETDGEIICQLNDLEPDESAEVEIVAVAERIGEAVHTAVVAGNETDPNPDNNTATTTVTIIEQPPIRQLYLPLIIRQ